MTVVILGWDALDIHHIDRFGLGESFGAHRDTIDTFVNPHIDEPHTKELWPSMITGLSPDEHGVHATADGGGPKWDSATLQAGSRVADHVLPDSLQTWIGARLCERVAETAEPTAASHYREQGIETVFDDGGRAISIPNYQTAIDRAHGLDASRDELWAALDVDRSGPGVRPQVDRGEVYGLLGRELGARVGETLQAIHADEPLVWTWFGLLDSVGHMQPALGDSLVEEWYQVAADVTQTIRWATDGTVVCVSDHGIREGSHTHYATVCSDDRAPVERIEHVFDVATWVRESVDVRGGRRDRGVDAVDLDAVTDELAALGYIEPAQAGGRS